MTDPYPTGVDPEHLTPEQLTILEWGKTLGRRDLLAEQAEAAMSSESPAQSCGCRSGSVYVHDHGCAKYPAPADGPRETAHRMVAEGRIASHSTLPPAEAQQDDERFQSILGDFDRQCYDARRAWRTTETRVPEDHAFIAGWRAALAARPSADTETLRRVRELADELERRGRERMTASRNPDNARLAKQLRSGALTRLADVDLLRAALDGPA